jgi:hypothetical protein
MKTRTPDRLATAGAGFGLAIFAVFGLQPGAYIGGMLGVNAVGLIWGTPVLPTLAARAAVTGGMLLSVLATGTLFTLSGASIGWLAGQAANMSLSLTRTLKHSAARQ